MHSWLKWMGTSVLLAGLVGCTPPEDENTEGLSIIPASKNIDDKGTTTQLNVSALDPAGKAGTGEVTLTTPAGIFANNAKSVTLTLDANGKASTTYGCSLTQDSACKGSVRIAGAWGALSGGTTIQVGTSTTPTNPTDGGTTQPTDGGTTPPPVTQPGKPANIIFDTEGGTASELGIRSVGLKTATPVVFTVLDIEGKPVANADVTFSVVGPAGVSLVPSTTRTGSSGKASTVLQSGDEVGVATVAGSISPETGGTLTATTPAVSIIGARVSDRGLVVECNQLILSANMTETPPRKDVKTTCTANLSDRFANLITAKTTVTWYSEAGAISSPTQSTEGSGLATANFSTAGKWPPVPVAPLTAAEAGEAEPTNPDPGMGNYNPRDMLVTVIAVTSGEEEFYDGSGVSNGVKNGQWDKGEWFVDTPEPFVDANDNQVYDYGEAFIDSERLNCATGKLEAKNGKWDGPNGCWDGSTMLWRSTHVVYSGYNSVDGVRFVGTVQPTLPNGTVYSTNIRVTDSYLNLISPDSAAFDITTPDKSVAVRFTDVYDVNSRSFGMQIIHERVEITPDPGQSRGYRVVGVCDPGKTPGAGAGTDPTLARCIWRYRFGKFNIRPNTALLTLTTTERGVSGVRVALKNSYGVGFNIYYTTVQ